jgi:hypothetical protein
MSISFLRFRTLVVVGLCTALSGCEIPERQPPSGSVEDGGASLADVGRDVSSDQSGGGVRGDAAPVDVGDVGAGGTVAADARGDRGSGGASGGAGGATGGIGGAGGATGGIGGAGGATGGSGGTGGSGVIDASLDRGTGGGGSIDASVDTGPICGNNQKMCGSSCVSTSDPGYGCAGTACTPCTFVNAASTCAPSGQCAMGSCNASFADCNTDAKDGCETDLSKPETCGSCTKKCDASLPLCSNAGGAFQCVSGCTAPASSRCGSQCVDVQTNAEHCGQCDTQCKAPTSHGNAACQAGKCVTTCNANYTVCGIECVDTKNNLAHCGGCNQACSRACVQGLCCNAGQSNCSDACVDTRSDLANCGGCGRTCNGTCTNGTCIVCGSGQTLCNGTCCAAGQGCCGNQCVALDMSPNCGACGTTCASDKLCGGTGTTRSCVWPDGHVCGMPNECASGVCGGRCCRTTAACACTQPTAANLVRNPGFDNDTTGWAFGSSIGVFRWQNGTTALPGGHLADAQSCAWSGTAVLDCDFEFDSCGRAYQCIEIEQNASYAFGARVGSDARGETRCSVELHPGPGCVGTGQFTDTVFRTDTGWSATFQSFTFTSGANMSAQINCERIGLGTGTFDMVYLSKRPGGY